MRLTFIQSRLAASLGVAASLLPLHLAFAQELSGEGRDTHNDALKPRLAPGYEPVFSSIDRTIIGRAPAGVTPLDNNIPRRLELQPGSTQFLVFERPGEVRTELRRDIGGTQDLPQENGLFEDAAASSGDLDRRQAPTRSVYISATTCQQPQVKADATAPEIPQLTLFISTKNLRDLTQNGNSSDPNMTWRIFDEGAAMFNITTSENVFVGIQAPALPNTISGSWGFEVAASTDQPYHGHSSIETRDLMWMDSDASGALMVTRTASGLSEGDQGPYELFASRADGKNRTLSGIRNSYCGLQNYAEISATKGGEQSVLVRSSLVKRATGNMAKQQFHLTGLQAGTVYDGIIATKQRANLPGGGGLVFRSTQFTTRQVENSSCMLVSGLAFCDKVAYKVPANTTAFPNPEALGKAYDDQAKEIYDSFEIQIAQVQCETENAQIYSLARTCDDCRAAYKDWLCSVSIPRCEEVTENKGWLHNRNFDNSDGQLETFEASSRNSFVNEAIVPRPYKELLPCDELCYDLVQSCPNSMGFVCPTPQSKYGFNHSYHIREQDEASGEFKCNFPDNAHFIGVRKSAAGTFRALAGSDRFLSHSVVMYGIVTALGLALM
ncbi:calcium influx-promoting protein ehs1 [Pyricularia oryzae 70-15]|nr:calcium influx-promoting protein ehs1 [Pyricularia oryzae 70-15]EHA47483.1 calcium influx-promoting protein ehs1 [Pyricularia oryzae 70-15]